MPLVVKIGGSLYDWPELGPRLARWLHEHDTPETVMVAGGGSFAQDVRTLVERHRLDDDTAHWLALRSMDLGAGFVEEILEMNGYKLDFTRATGVRDCFDSWSRKDRPILDAYRFSCEDDLKTGALPHSWNATSDSVAARLAELLAAELVLLKSAEPPPGNFTAWAAAGYVDSHFPTVVARARLTVRAVNLRAY